MKVTIPLRLPQDVLDAVDRIIEMRKGEQSRNSVLRELIARGLEVESKKGRQ